MPDDLMPTAFIVMPYGKKRDPSSGVVIDFDDIWNSAYRPAVEGVGLEAVRADEEHLGGFVHLAMFERLILAEYVLADLTLAGPNVMYELGIRHAARQRSTVSTFATPSTLPFDISPIRAIPYRLNKKGRLSKIARNDLINALQRRFRAVMTDSSADSPLFQLIRDYPGVVIAHNATETFQHRHRTLVALGNEIRGTKKGETRQQRINRLRDLAEKIRGMGNDAPTELLIDIFLAFRDEKAYDDMIQLEAHLPEPMRRHETIRQQVALAMNRRNDHGDRETAKQILRKLISEFRPSPETYGLLGRIYKNEFMELRESNPEAARLALRDAIKAYERGFLADIRDYYPGVNAVTLLTVEGSKKSLKRARTLAPSVALAVAQRHEDQTERYWNVASAMELAVARMDQKEADKSCAQFLRESAPTWAYESAAENLELLYRSFRKDLTTDWVQGLVERLRAAGS